MSLSGIAGNEKVVTLPMDHIESQTVKKPQPKTTETKTDVSGAASSKLAKKIQGGGGKEVSLPKPEKFSFGSNEQGFTEYSFYKPTNKDQLNKLKSEGFVPVKREGVGIGFMKPAEAKDYLGKNPNAKLVEGEVALIGGKLVALPTEPASTKIRLAEVPSRPAK